MRQEKREWHLRLPVGRRRETGRLMTLAEALEAPDLLAAAHELSYEDRAEIALARWSAGEWEDMHFGTDGLVDLERARTEVAAHTQLGEALVAFEEQVVRLTFAHINDPDEPEEATS